MNIKNKKLLNLVKEIFIKYKLNSEHAKISARALINAELVGAYGHGLSRLKMYCDRIKKKVINPKPKIKTINISQSISQIDADNICYGTGWVRGARSEWKGGLTMKSVCTAWQS